MATTNQRQARSDNEPVPIFASVGRRSSRRVATAILALMIAAVAAVAAVVVVDSIG
jgi:hypothetical protein